MWVCGCGGAGRGEEWEDKAGVELDVTNQVITIRYTATPSPDVSRQFSIVTILLPYLPSFPQFIPEESKNEKDNYKESTYHESGTSDFHHWLSQVSPASFSHSLPQFMPVENENEKDNYKYQVITNQRHRLHHWLSHVSLSKVTILLPPCLTPFPSLCRWKMETKWTVTNIKVSRFRYIQTPPLVVSR